MQLFNIQKIASESGNFRKVVWTGENSQLVVMTIPVGGEIGKEVHEVDQHLTFISGVATAEVGGEKKEVYPGIHVVVPAGTEHNFVNSGPTPLILYTVYAPAEHADGAIHKTKEEGDKLEDEGKDEPPKKVRKT